MFFAYYERTTIAQLILFTSISTKKRLIEMMQMRDWVSGAVGLSIALPIVLSMNGYLDFVTKIDTGVFRWVLLVSGAYLFINSWLEITNSNIVGWWSLLAVSVPAIILGILPFFGIGLLSLLVYQIGLVAVGIFLMIATFAMEL